MNANERAHLDHRHHVDPSVTNLAPVVDPLLSRLSAALELSCARWADDDAAGMCRRDSVADALTRAPAGTRLVDTAVVLDAAVTDVDRVRALRGPVPRPAVWRVALLLSLLTMHATERLFELAQSAHHTGHH